MRFNDSDTLLKNTTKDVVIVFGAAVRERGEPSPALRRRALQGARLVLSGQAPVLIASGGVGRYPPSEAALIARLALAQGVPADRIILEEAAMSTLENARRSAAIMRSRGWSSAWAVSDRYHLRRCVYLLRQFGIAATGSAPDDAPVAIGRRLRELLALPWNALRVLALRLGLGE